MTSNIIFALTLTFQFHAIFLHIFYILYTPATPIFKVVSQKTNLIRRLDSILKRISSHPLFDARQGLLWESDLGHYWFTGDSMPTLSFHRPFKSSLRFLKWIDWAVPSDMLYVVSKNWWNLNILLLWHFTTVPKQSQVKYPTCLIMQLWSDNQ